MEAQTWSWTRVRPGAGPGSDSTEEEKPPRSMLMFTCPALLLLFSRAEKNLFWSQTPHFDQSLGLFVLSAAAAADLFLLNVKRQKRRSGILDPEDCVLFILK